MTTGRDIVRKALQKARVLVKSEEPDADEANDALDALNGMVSSWSNESLLVYARTWETFNVTGGVGEYTIGPSQTFNTVRPLFIVDAYVRLASIDYDLVVIPDEVYTGSIAYKPQQGIPEFINYDNGYPSAKIRLWPVPSSAYTLFLLSEKQLTTFTLDTVLSLPPGWERALVYNLAMEIAPDYGQEVDPNVLRIANQAKGNVKKAVARVRSMDVQPGPSGRKFNIYSGGFS